MRVHNFGIMALVFAAHAASAATYYVDYENGRNSASGTAPSQPWKHAPGDIDATAVPRSIQLKPGDVVQFKGGVAYRGTIRLRHSGVPGKPITYSGSGTAVFDLGDPVTRAEPCQSAASCGGAPNWQQLVRVTFSAPSTTLFKLFDAYGPLGDSMYPAMPDPFWQDDTSVYLKTPRSHAGLAESGQLKQAELAALAEPGMFLSFWARPNIIVRRKITAVSGDTMSFDPAKIDLYNDRDGRVALVGSPKTVTPGTFAPLSPTEAVVFPRSGGGTLSVGSGRHGFDLNGQSFITISGFHFVHGTAARSARTEGLAIQNLNHRATASGITIERNRFGPAALASRMGIIMARRFADTVVRDNHFTDIQSGSGIRTLNGNANLTVERNSFTRTGRTSIYFAGVRGGAIRQNIVRESLGIHGNGISLYLGNHDIQVTNNCVYNSPRPITYQGTRDAENPATNILFDSNILVATKGSQAAIIGYAARIRGVTISRNLLLGDRAGARIAATQENVTLAGNSGGRLQLIHGKSPGEGWRIADNDFNVPLSAASAGIFQPAMCMMPGHGGSLRVALP